MNSSEELLLEKCRQGDSASFKMIYNRYSRAMLNTANRLLNNRADAEDVLQESFVYAYYALKDIQLQATFGAWLKRIVVSRSIDLLRKRKMEWIEWDESDQVPLYEDFSEPEHLEIELEIGKVKKAMASLPPKYRTVMSLYLFEGFDQEEIAEILHVSHATVRTQYSRGKQKLLSLLKP